MIKKHLFLMALMLPSVAFAEVYNLNSPSGRISVSLQNSDKGLSYSIKVDNKSILDESSLGLVIDDVPLGGNKMNFLGEAGSEVREWFELFAGRSKEVKEF